MQQKNNMPEGSVSFAAVLSYLYDRKNILYSVISCVIGLFFLIIGMLVCDKSFWNYMFVWILPGTCVVILSTYAISMTDKHPIVLIFPPITFFASLFVRYLVTYEYTLVLILLLQFIPFLVFWRQANKFTYYKEVKSAVFCALLSVGCILTSIIVVNILDNAQAVSLPLYEHYKFEILTYVEIAIGAMYFSLGFLSKDMYETHVIESK